MYQLIKAVLAVGAGFAPVDRAGLIVHMLTIQRDMLADEDGIIEVVHERPVEAA